MRVILITIMLFTLGIFVLPSTISLFAGQHYWYNLDAQGNDIPCTKCHADVADELTASIQSSGYHDFNRNGVGDNRDCEACHRGTQLNWSSGYQDVAGEEAHAASVVRCMLCHSGDTPASHPGGNTQSELTNVLGCICHPRGGEFPPIAGGFNLSANADDTGIYAAHRSFVLESRNSSLLFSENEACIACHTQVWLLFNYTSASGISIVVNNTYTSTQSSWQIESSSVATTVYRINSTDRTVKGTYEVVR